MMFSIKLPSSGTVLQGPAYLLSLSVENSGLSHFLWLAEITLSGTWDSGWEAQAWATVHGTYGIYLDICEVNEEQSSLFLQEIRSSVTETRFQPPRFRGLKVEWIYVVWKWHDAGTCILLSLSHPGILGGMREKAMNFFIFLLIWRISSCYYAFLNKTKWSQL